MVGVPAVRRKHVLTPEIIEALKAALLQAELPDEIYKFTEGDDVFVFRPLLRKDYLEILGFSQTSQGNVTNEMYYQKVCEKCLLWPDIAYDAVQWDVQRAGIQESLARFILAKSGFLSPEADPDFYLEPLSESRQDARPDPAFLKTLEEQSDFPLHLAGHGHRWYVVRPLKRIEWSQLVQKNGDEEALKVALVERAIVWSSTPGKEKPDFAQELAGTVDALSQVVQLTSGFLSQAHVERL